MSRDCPLHALRGVRSWRHEIPFFVYLLPSLFDIARQLVCPPRLPLYRFARSCILVELSSNPLKSSRQLYVAINSFESDACLSSVRM